jgi:hypothetical protein
LWKKSHGRRGKVLIPPVTAIIRWVCSKTYEETHNIGKIAFLPLKFAEFAEKPTFFSYLQKYPTLPKFTALPTFQDHCFFLPHLTPHSISILGVVQGLPLVSSTRSFTNAFISY